MADLSSVASSDAYKKFTQGLDLANMEDAVENDLVNFENEKSNRATKTLHTNMKNVSENTKGLQF